MSGPLSGIKVLELGRYMSAPWCGQMLGDLGADVIKLERPGGGDQIRQYGPPFLTDDGTTPTESSYFLCANRNKRSITVDLATDEGRETVLDLVAGADILLENFRVGRMAKLGLDYQSLAERNP